MSPYLYKVDQLYKKANVKWSYYKQDYSFEVIFYRDKEYNEFYLNKYVDYIIKSQVNDPVNDPVNELIDESIKASKEGLNNIDLNILKIIILIPGLNTIGIFEQAKKLYSNITIDIIKNTLKRKLNNYVEFSGCL